MGTSVPFYKGGKNEAQCLSNCLKIALFVGIRTKTWSQDWLTFKKTLCFLQQTRLPHSSLHILETSSSCSSAISQFYKSKTTLLLGHTAHPFPWNIKYTQGTFTSGSISTFYRTHLGSYQMEMETYSHIPYKQKTKNHETTQETCIKPDESQTSSWTISLNHTVYRKNYFGVSLILSKQAKYWHDHGICLCTCSRHIHCVST